MLNGLRKAGRAGRPSLTWIRNTDGTLKQIWLTSEGQSNMQSSYGEGQTTAGFLNENVYHDETIVTDEVTGGQKGVKESELHCLPRESAWELGRVFKMGGLKHGDYNFRKGFAWSMLYDAAMRHATSFWDGESWNVEEFQAKDGSYQSWRVHHAIQAAWHLLILAFFDITGRGKDDRPQ